MNDIAQHDPSPVQTDARAIRILLWLAVLIPVFVVLVHATDDAVRRGLFSKMLGK